MPKMLQLVQKCGDCPHYEYYSGGQYKCRLTGEVVRDKTVIAPFCPLTGYPSRMLARMEATIQVLRDSRKYGLAIAVLSHIATKLDTMLGPDGVVAIALKNGETVYLAPDHITEMAMQPFCSIQFLSGKKVYMLCPDTVPPQLSVQIEAILDGVNETLWRRCELAQE